MHISATATALPGVAVRSKAGRFERDGCLQCPNTWQNRDLRPLLPPGPTGLGGPRSQPRTLPADVHCGVTGAAGRRPCASSRGGWLVNGLPRSKHALLASGWSTKDPPSTIFDVDHEPAIHFDVRPMEKDEISRKLFFISLRLAN